MLVARSIYKKLLAVWRHELLVLSETIRFLDLVMSAKWEPYRKPRDQIIAELGAAPHSFTPLANHHEERPSWDYLLHIRVDQYSQERLATLYEKHAKKQQDVQVCCWP